MKGNQSTLMRALYEAGQVRRWHNLPHHGEVTVAHHSWGAAVFILTFHDGLPATDELDAPPGPSLSLIRAALLHDAHERWTGDGPSPARRAIPSLQKGEDLGQDRVWTWAQEEHPEKVLSPRELVWLRLADAVEAWLWTKVQYAMGNQFVRWANNACWEAIQNIVRANEGMFLDADGLLQAIKDINLGNRLPESLLELEEKY